MPAAEAATDADLESGKLAMRAEPRSEASARSSSGAGPTVLLVEDDPAVRRLTARLLGRLGYRPLVAVDATEARALAAAAAEGLGLLVTDVEMPGTAGPDLARELAAERPGLRTLFISGYARDAARLSELLAAGNILLSKPFGQAELERALTELLDPPAPRD